MMISSELALTSREADYNREWSWRVGEVILLGVRDIRGGEVRGGKACYNV